MKYYFDIVGARSERDAEGAEYASAAAARQEALLRALNFQASHRLQTYNGFASISVRDEAGHRICEVEIKH